MNKYKVAFIVRTTEGFYTEQCIDYISKIVIPENYESELFCISECDDEGVAFEEGNNQTDAYYRVYLTDCTFILNEKIIYEIIDIFEKNETCTCISMKGTEFDGISVLEVGISHKSKNVYVTRENGVWNDEAAFSTDNIDDKWLYTDSSIAMGDDNTKRIRDLMINIVNEKRFADLFELSNEIKSGKLLDGVVRTIWMLGDIYKLENNSTDGWHSELFSIDGYDNIYSYFQIIKTFIVKAGMQNDMDSIAFLREMYVGKKISEDLIISIASAVLTDQNVIYEEVLDDLEKSPLVSIIVPTYNTGDILRYTLDSCINQKYDNLEVIVIDDASTDDTVSIIQEYEQKDTRIKAIYSKTNMHVCGASICALREARGEYIALIGHDDVFDLSKTIRQVRFMEKHKAYGVCFSWMNIVNENNVNTNLTSQPILRVFCEQTYTRAYIYQLFTNVFIAPTALIRKACLDETGFYRMGLVQLQDYDLWLRILAKYEYYLMPQALVDYRHFQQDSEGRHLSTLTLEKENRLMHEKAWLMYTNIMKLSLESFRMLFRNRMIDNDICDEEELLCEKLLLLKDIGNPFTFVGFFENLDREAFMNTLVNKYNVSLQDFYKYNMESFTLDNQLSRYALSLKEKYDEINKKI